MHPGIGPEFVEACNRPLERAHRRRLDRCRAELEERGVDLEPLLARAMAFGVALPSWGLVQGGTRFGKFPMPGEPAGLEEKLLDAAVVQSLTRLTPRVSLHFPWDRFEAAGPVRRLARDLGLAFDAVNSNTFQDQPGQRLSYRWGSLSHADPAVRRQAVDHNLECIGRGRELGSKALVVWLADGSSFPGQIHFRRALERTLDSLRAIYAALPPGWRLLVEHKPFEPAFYASVIPDWGASLLLVQSLGPQAQCLVDLGHHLPNANIEQEVAYMIHAGRLGGFHFNDSKYADDDVTAGSIHPYRLFLVFHELVEALGESGGRRRGLRPAHLIDQSHNLKDPIEDLIQSALEIQRAHVKACLVDRLRLAEFQEANDVVMAERELKRAFETEVSPLLAEASRRQGGAIDPIAAYRALGYRAARAAQGASNRLRSR